MIYCRGAIFGAGAICEFDKSEIVDFLTLATAAGQETLCARSMHRKPGNKGSLSLEEVSVGSGHALGSVTQCRLPRWTGNREYSFQCCVHPVQCVHCV